MKRPALPTSLMHRLTLLANGQLLPVPIESSKPPPRTADYLGTFVWFGLGALTSAALGGVAFLSLQALAAPEARVEAGREVVPAAVAEVPPAKPARYNSFDVAIDRGGATRVPFGLRLTGTEDDAVEVVMQGIPATARLSRGEQRDAATWVVKRADLAGLYLTLGEGTPDAFDVRIDVLAPPPGAATVGSLMRVRLVDSGSPAATAASHDRSADRRASTVAPVTDVAKLAAAQTSEAAETVRPPPAQRRAPPVVADATVAALPPARPWPEGASGLGAIPRDSERQVWWNMPPPSWSPFQDRVGTQ